MFLTVMQEKINKENTIQQHKPDLLHNAVYLLSTILFEGPNVWTV